MAAATESAKAARLLRGQHRLALSGTPIENHLGELWSLFEFLNPGMLGAASVLMLLLAFVSTDLVLNLYDMHNDTPASGYWSPVSPTVNRRCSRSRR